MAYNIELNYYNGTAYQILYPKGIFSNMTGSLTASQIPSLDSSKITTGTFGASRISGGTFSSGSEFIFPNNVRIKNSTNYGMKLNFGDGDYVYLYEDTDDNLTIKAKRIEFTTTQGLTNNGSSLGGLKSITNTYKGTGSGTVTLTTGFLPVLAFVVQDDGQGMEFIGTSSSTYSGSWMLMLFYNKVNAFEEWKARETAGNGGTYQRTYTYSATFASTYVSFASNAQGAEGNVSRKTYNWIAIG